MLIKEVMSRNMALIKSSDSYADIISVIKGKY